MNKLITLIEQIVENKLSANEWDQGEYRYIRSTDYRNRDLIHVKGKDGNEYIQLTTIYPEEMAKKKLNFYLNKDVEYFKKTYR